MAILTLAAKDLRYAHPRSRGPVALYHHSLLLILVLGLAAGESFGQTPDDRMLISVVNLDEGHPAGHAVPEKDGGAKW